MDFIEPLYESVSYKLGNYEDKKQIAYFSDTTDFNSLTTHAIINENTLVSIFIIFPHTPAAAARRPL